MSINGIGNYQLSANSLYTAQSATPVDTTGDADRSRVSAPTATAGRTGLFSSAISQTLFQIGVTPAAANVATGAAPTNTQQQAVNSFVQNLFGALQTLGLQPSGNAGAKNSGSSKKDAKSTDQTQAIDSNDSAQTTTPSDAAVLPSGSTLENRLQSLIQQLGSSASSNNTGQDNLSALQQSFQSLLKSQGADNNKVSLGSFLQTLSQNLQDIPPSGSLISTSA